MGDRRSWLPPPLLAAVGLLTRWPVPAVANAAARDGAPAWFPAVGLLLGAALALAAWLAQWLWEASLAAWAVVACWVAATGAMHLDGVADLADGLGAAHRETDREDARARLLMVMREPHLGAFGAVALVLLLAGKLVAAEALLADGGWLIWLFVPAWARLGALVWAHRLPPLDDRAGGMGGGLAARVSPAMCWRWGGALAFASLLAAPALLLAPLVIWGWGAWLRRRAGGMNGDALGAGIEWVELALMTLAAA